MKGNPRSAAREAGLSEHACALSDAGVTGVAQLRACVLVQVELAAVRPDGGGGEEELRLGAAVLPLRLRIDQAVVEFLQVTLRS